MLSCVYVDLSHIRCSSYNTLWQSRQWKRDRVTPSKLSLRLADLLQLQDCCLYVERCNHWFLQLLVLERLINQSIDQRLYIRWGHLTKLRSFIRKQTKQMLFWGRRTLIFIFFVLFFFWGIHLRHFPDDVLCARALERLSHVKLRCDQGRQ